MLIEQSVKEPWERVTTALRPRGFLACPHGAHKSEFKERRFFSKLVLRLMDPTQPTLSFGGVLHRARGERHTHSVGRNKGHSARSC